MKEQALYVFIRQGENITPDQVMCFAHNLAKDALSEAPKLNWDLDKSTPKAGVYISNGLHHDSKIMIETISTPRGPVILMSYSRKGRLICNAYEFCGNSTETHVLLSLYQAVVSVVGKIA